MDTAERIIAPVINEKKPLHGRTDGQKGDSSGLTELW